MPATARNAALLTPDELSARLGVLYGALDEFNDGYFFESHETLEELWLVAPLPARRFFQGVIQLAAAYVHVARGEWPGAVKLLDAALAKLREFAPAYLGIDVAAMARDATAGRGDLAGDRGTPSVRTAVSSAPRWRFERQRPDEVAFM